MTCADKQTASSPPPPIGGDYQSQRAHLLWMASMDGAFAHAKLRAEQLDKDPSGLWMGIYEDVNTELKRLQSLALADGQGKV